MSMLIEKRQELMNELASLEAARKKEIDEKVEAYRVSIEANTPKEKIEKVKNVINALDEVIAYDSALVSSVEQTVIKDSGPVLRPDFAQAIESRPGMATVFSPSRE